EAGVHMAFLKQMLLIGMTLSTAAGTLFAGLPHMECLCLPPVGQADNSSSTCEGRACCGRCGGSCCSGASCCRQPAESPTTRSCCGQQAEPSRDDLAPGQRFEGRHCTTGLVAAPFSGVVSAQPSHKGQIAIAAAVCLTPIFSAPTAAR